MDFLQAKHIILYLTKIFIFKILFYNINKINFLGLVKTQKTID